MLHVHPPENIRHFAKHMLATFLGLLMALGLEQWREHRQERQVLREAMEAVQEELAQNQETLTRSIQRCETSRTSLRALLPQVDGLIQARKRGGPLPAVSECAIGTSWTLSSDAWSALKAMGLLRALPAAKVKALSHAYGSAESMDQMIRLQPCVQQMPSYVFRALEDPTCYKDLDTARLETTLEYLKDLDAFFLYVERSMTFTRGAVEAARKI